MAIQNKITDLAIRKLKPQDKELLIPDGGGLYLRVRSISDGGAISFRFRYLRQSKQFWMTLKANSLADARKERDKYKEMVKKGIDPISENKLITERARVAQLAEEEALAKQQALISVTHLYERWLKTDLQKRKDLPEIQRMFEKDVLPKIGGLVVQDVRKGHITEVTDMIKQRGSASTARNVLKLIRQLFTFAVNRDVIEFSPVASLSVSKTTTKNSERNRVLSQDEIRQLSNKLPEAGLMVSTECAVWIMLSTLCRVGEISKAEWSHIDFDKRTFLIPASNAKNGKAHIVFLSDFALANFQRLRSIKLDERWLFPNRSGLNHVCEKSITKMIDGRQNPKVHSNRSKANQALVLPGGKWTPHDLRRTGATLMGDLGVNSDVISKCQNHTEENKLKRVYQHQKLLDEQSQAWKILGERLAILTSQSNIIPFQARS